MKKNHLTAKKFAHFDLDDRLQAGLNEAEFEFCTPIQAATLPVTLAGRDVAGQAQTGTGKTIAFLLAGSNALLRQQPSPTRKSTDVRALILAPTRELAIQIHQDAERLLKHTELQVGLIYGGTKYDDQKNRLERGVDMLIGTPGRLIDLFKQKLFSLKYAQVLVIDEADRMFDLGFIRDIRFLIQHMPPANNRLNLLYSATLSYRVMELAYEHMNDPEEIRMDDQIQVASGVEEQCYCPATEEKPVLLVNMLKRFQPSRALVFANTRKSVDLIHRLLKKHQITQGILAGHASQESREKQLERFKKGKLNVLVATDVAARGLHIPDVSHVFNYDLPQDSENYIHRVGRTARAGLDGMAISFLCDKYAFAIEAIESLVGHELPKHEIEPWMLENIDSTSTRQSRDAQAADQDKSKSDPVAQTTAASQQDAMKLQHHSKDSELPVLSAHEQPSEQDKSQSDIEVEENENMFNDADEQPIRPKPIKFVPFEGPKNRFSKHFGEIPMIG